MYADDLAYIHDAGFSHHARGTATGLVALLAEAGIARGTVVELGCGAGTTAAALLAAGHDVIGVDQSAGLLRLARKRAPGAKFIRQSFFEYMLPPCNAIVSVGECLGYRHGKRGGTGAMMSVLQRAARALRPDGILCFDLVTSRVARNAVFVRGGDDWFLVSQNARDRAGAWLTRDITTFRRRGSNYRRGEETHHVQLYRSGDIANRLRKLGFAVRIRRSLGGYALPPGRALFIARKRR